MKFRDKIPLSHSFLAAIATNLDLLTDYMDSDDEPKRQGPEEHDAHREHTDNVRRMVRSLQWMLREEMNLGNGGGA